MTQASNVGILTPKINSSGQLDATTGLTGAVPVANGGTGAATYTANNVLLGNGTSAFQVVAPGTTGNVLTSNGTTWTSSAPSSGGGVYQYALFGSSGSWTAPTGVTKVKITIFGGGGGGNTNNTLDSGQGGCGIGYFTVTPGTAYTITIGAGGTVNNTGGTSSFGALISATGGSPGNSTQTGGNGSCTNAQFGSNYATNAQVTAVGSVFTTSFGNFVGSSQNLAATNTNSPVTWSTSAQAIPGARGRWTRNVCDAIYANAGVGGAILIEYMG